MKKKTAAKKKQKTAVPVAVRHLVNLRSELHQLSNTLDELRSDLAPSDHRLYCAACAELGIDPFA